VPFRVVSVSAVWATRVVCVTKNVGSFVNVTVADPSTVAVPTATSPVEVNS
jgi:hypothetical protein